MESTYNDGTLGANGFELPQTTEYGAAVLENIESEIRELGKEEFDKLFGRICRLVKYHNGGHVAWDDLENMVYGVCSETGVRRRDKLKADLRAARRKVGQEWLAPDGDSKPADYRPQWAPVAEDEPTYPDPVAVEALWSRTLPCAIDDIAYHWLMLRGLSVREVEFQRLARFIPPDVASKMTAAEVEAVKAVLPRTVIDGKFGAATQLGFRVAAPMYDVDGVMRSLRLRYLNVTYNKKGFPRLREQPKDERKELSIKGRAKGLILANGPALELLRSRGRRPDAWGGRELAVVVAEGVPDFLAASCEPDKAVRAVFGITGPGAWSLDLAARIPFDARVEIATDSDPAGEKYAAEVEPTLFGRRVVNRWRPWWYPKRPQTKKKIDLADVFGLRGGFSHAIR